MVGPMTANLDTRLASFSSPALSVFRIVFGLLYMLHGSIKLFGWPLGTAVPTGTWPFWFAGLIEFVLGLLIATTGAGTFSADARRRPRAATTRTVAPRRRFGLRR